MAPPLSPRKRGKIVAHVLDGETYKEIAQKYNIAKGTVAYSSTRTSGLIRMEFTMTWDHSGEQRDSNGL